MQRRNRSNSGHRPSDQVPATTRYATTGMVPHGAIVTWTAAASVSNSRAARDRGNAGRMC